MPFQMRTRSEYTANREGNAGPRRFKIRGLLGLLVLARFASAAGPTYTIKDLGALGGTPNAMGINKYGQVTGTYKLNTGYPRAFFWDGTSIRDIGDLGGGVSNGQGINSAGHITGFSINGNGYARAFLWNGTTMTDIGALPGDLQSNGMAINDADHITGTSSSGAFFWNGSAMQNIGTIPGGMYPIGTGINNADIITGSVILNIGVSFGLVPHAVLWNGPTVLDLGTLPGWAASRGAAINDASQVTGGVNESGSPAVAYSPAFLWDGITMRDIGGLFGASFGQGINNLGQVVGSSNSGDSASPMSHAFFWDGSMMWDLNSQVNNMAGWTELSLAYAINDSGQITGYGTLNGAVHAFLLTPSLLGGTITVTTNLSGASFNITGPANYSGTGAGFTVNNAPAGTYTITFAGVACYAVPASQTLTLTAGQTITFNGSYQGAASISVSVTPAGATSATFSVSPPIPGMRSTGPYTVTQTGLVPQPYMVTFNAVNGFQSPSQITLSPGATCNLTFIGNYIPVAPSATATLAIQSNVLQGAQFIIFKSGTTSIVFIGTGPSPIQLSAPASYDVVYTALQGYYTPPMVTVTLAPGTSASLRGIYRRLILVSFTGWNNAPSSSSCLPPPFDSPFNSILGSGITYPEPSWRSSSAGMISLLYDIQQTPGLGPGANMAGFTFYSTDGKGNQLGNACTPGSDTGHTEAMNWFRAQNVTPDDLVAVVGHSYGGNRAWLFADSDLALAGFHADYLATVDPIDWDKCDPTTAIAAFIASAIPSVLNLCDQSSSQNVHPDSATFADSFRQLNGIQSLLGIPLPVPIVPFPKGYTISPASISLSSADHSTIDNDPVVRSTIESSLTTLVNNAAKGRPQITMVPGVPTRTNGMIVVPITLSLSGKGSVIGTALVTASLNGVPSSSLPLNLGNLPTVTSNLTTGTLIFPGTAATSGTTVLLNVAGSYLYDQQRAVVGTFRIKTP
jgi:probable HAF family extracellular repeat protein